MLKLSFLDGDLEEYLNLNPHVDHGRLHNPTLGFLENCTDMTPQIRVKPLKIFRSHV